ncbi:PaaX family transcriptional regulator C-terminal domain-containing protein [Embleya sp. NPDC127516]|uniref:PaaX family transcriptional regulator n=1 Tax=Embleya sp. NPDC127516 TaxID=3363990 RepID=UPI00380EC3C6
MSSTTPPSTPAPLSAANVLPVVSRPQELLLALLAGVVLDRHTEPLPSRVFLDALDRLDVAAPAARATLNRMVHRDLLHRGRDGREAVYTISAACRNVLLQGKGRVLSRTPFEHRDDRWTLLSFSLPEPHRDLRHQLRSRLQWAGFGCARDGLWIAPGTVDITEALDGLDLPDAEDSFLDAFAAQPLPPTRMHRLVRRAWDLDALRAAHEAFLARWERHDPNTGDPLPLLASVLADWIHLLRTDPGLPATHLGPDWPAARSAAAFHALHDRCEQPARDAFDASLRPPRTTATN